MVERPILFSAPMVRAILDGRKTQTRRVVDCPADTVAVRWVDGRETMPTGSYTGWAVQCGAPLLLPRKCPYGAPGDRLWVRETWGLLDTQPKDGPGRATILYRATDGERRDLRHQLWRPSIHMPRWASRVTLEITDVRVQRLQEISRDDAIAEGLWEDDSAGWRWLKPAPTLCYHGPHQAFGALWDSVNGERSGCSARDNPWVWALTFRRVEQEVLRA